MAQAMSDDASLRSCLLSISEPPRTVHYDTRRAWLWPIIVPALLALCTVIALVVVTNFSASTCSEQLDFNGWWGAYSRARGCRSADTIATDWTPWATRLQLMDPPSMTMFSFPNVRLYDATWTPTGCDEDTTYPIAYPWFNLSIQRQSSQSDHRFFVTILAGVEWPEFSVAVQVESDVPGAVEPNITLGAGWLSVSSAPYSRDNTRVTGSSWPSDSAQVRLLVELYLHGMHSDALGWWYNQACAQFCVAKHVQSCWTCTPNSATSITSIIVLGVLQAIAITGRVTLWLLRRCNRAHMLKSEDDALLQPEFASTADAAPSTGAATDSRFSDLHEALFPRPSEFF